jgi:O-antigen ligase
MKNITSAALFFLASGILTSVTILSAYQILFAVPLIYFTFQALKNNRFSLPKSAYWLLAFALLAFISILMNWDIVTKPSRNIGKIKYFLYGTCGILVLRVWLDEVSVKTKRLLSNTFLLSIVVAGLVTSWQYFFHNDGRAKSLTDTMRYGYGSAMLLLTLLGAILNRGKFKEWFNPKFGLVAFIIGFLGMYFTLTRGALLGFLCGLPFLLYFYRPKLGLMVGGAATLIIAFLGAFYLFGNLQQGGSSRFLISKNYNGDIMRRSQWNAAIIAIQERPLLGWGFSNFSTQVKRIKNTYDLEAKDYDDAHAHNLFLEIAAGTGLIGLFIFLGWLISWAIECFKDKNLVRNLVVPFGVAFVISSQFEVTFDANNASMIFFLYSLSMAHLTKKS